MVLQTIILTSFRQAPLSRQNFPLKKVLKTLRQKDSQPVFHFHFVLVFLPFLQSTIVCCRRGKVSLLVILYLYLFICIYYLIFVFIFCAFFACCKSLLCSMFNEQTCSRFTRLLFFVTMPEIAFMPIYIDFEHRRQYL